MRALTLTCATVMALGPACVLELDLRTGGPGGEEDAEPVPELTTPPGLLDALPLPLPLPRTLPNDPTGPIGEEPLPTDEVVADDPLSDGGRASWVFLHDGLVWVGPNATGDAAARFTPDGDFVDTVAFEIAGDTTAPHRTSNSSGSPFSSFGAPGCAPDTPACGPDNEDGAVLMGSFTLGGEEVLIAAGGKSGGHHTYVYVGRLVHGVARFEYLDVAAATGPQTLGVTSIMSTHDGVLLGLPQRGVEGPRLLELLRAPAVADDAQGLEARVSPTCEAADGDVCNLAAQAVPALHGESNAPGPPSAQVRSIDAVLEVVRPVPGAEALESTTWIASTDGIARCDGPLAPATSSPDRWTSATPTSPAFTSADPIRSSATSATPLRERAIPGFARAGETILFGRNTEDGPQLWRCSGACEPDAWQSVSGVVDGAERVSLVQTFPGGVLVGTDAPARARLAWSADGFTFHDVDVGAQLLGTRLLSALAVPCDHGTTLWMMTADDVGPARLVRVLLP